MSGLANYISVLRKPAIDGELTVKIRSKNKPVPAQLDVRIDVEADMDEEDLATRINDVLTEAYVDEQFFYNGIPAFAQDYSLNSDNRPPFALRNYQCDHIINVFCQVPYTLKIKDTSGEKKCGAIVMFDSTPIYPTVAEAKRFARPLGADFEGYEDEEIVDSMLLCSQEIVGFMGDAGVATQYLHKVVGDGSDGTMLDHFPVIENDHPVIRGPGLIGLVGTGGFPVEEGYELDEDGALSFRDWGVMPYMEKPLDFNNLMAITYVAGMANVHPTLKKETVRLSTFIGVPLHVQQIKVGTFQANLGKREDAIALVKHNLERISR